MYNFLLFFFFFLNPSHSTHQRNVLVRVWLSLSGDSLWCIMLSYPCACETWTWSVFRTTVTMYPMALLLVRIITRHIYSYMTGVEHAETIDRYLLRSWHRYISRCALVCSVRSGCISLETTFLEPSGEVVTGHKHTTIKLITCYTIH